MRVSHTAEFKAEAVKRVTERGLDAEFQASSSGK